MALDVSLTTRIAASRTVKEPNLVLCIDGLDDCLGSGTIIRLIYVGDDDLIVDGSWLIGGQTTLGGGDNSLVSMEGSSTSIKQQLDVDKARGSSIQSIDIELVDLNGAASALVSPGVVLEDILGRKARVYLALDKNTASWPDDYLLLFRGIVSDIKAFPASVTLSISHPEQLKKQTVWPKFEATLPTSISDSQTIITLSTVDGLLERVQGPDGSYDSSFTPYIRIDDEIIGFTSIVGTSLQGCTRGALGTIPAGHDEAADVASFYRLEGTAMDLALKLMLSKEGDFITDREITSINVMPDLTVIPNAIYFSDENISEVLGLTVGDYVSLSGSTDPANDFTYRQITAVARYGSGSYITVDGASLVDESPSPALLAARSKYDTLPMALGMGPDDVDVTQHEYLRRQYLSSFYYDIYIRDTIEDAREFIEQQIYKPASAYSLPRKTRSSVQLLIGPIPGSQLPVLGQSNIIQPSAIRIRRTINRNFYNTIVYRYDEDELEEGNYRRGRITKDQVSIDRIPVGTKALVIDAKGMRPGLNGANLALDASNRRINRYKYGAEFIEGLKVTLGVGYLIEVGDIVVLDPTGLNLLNSSDGSREKPSGLYEVQNKSLNYKTGEVTLDIVDTAFDGSGRYCLVGPSSYVKAGISQTELVIEPSFLETYGTAEFQKWQPYPFAAVVVRSPDSTTRYGLSRILSSSSNTIQLEDPLGFIPEAGDIMELAPYDYVDTTSQVKLVYGHQAPLNAGADDPYQML